MSRIKALLRPVCLAAGLLCAGLQSLTAQTAPVGYIVYRFPASATGTTTYLSAPLASAIAFSGTATAIGANSITVATASWTTNQFVQTTGGEPYYVLMKSGAQAGRTLLITSNTSTQLTVDITDNSTQSTSLLTTGFAAAANDTFEVSPGYTLSSLFGAGSFPGSGASLDAAGGIGLWDSSTQAFDYYYYNSTAGHWVKNGASTTTDAGDTGIPPGATIAISLPAGYAGGAFVNTGRAATVAPLLKDTGGNLIRYYGLFVPADMALSQLSLGSNWTKGSSIFTADTLSVYNSALAKWDTYYQLTSGGWRKAGSSATQDATVISAGSAVAFLKRTSVSGSNSYFPIPLPYTP